MKTPGDKPQAQKTARLKREAHAQQINDTIDHRINRSKPMLRQDEEGRIQREKGILRVLLLGQSESGKSTLLKNFRIRYSRAEWGRERNGWRTVVHLNVVHSIIAIFKIVEARIDNNSEADDDNASPYEFMKFTYRHQLLLNRLAPLSIVEDNLKRKLACFLYPSSSGSSQQFPIPFGVSREDNVRLRIGESSWSGFLEQEALCATDPTTSIAEYKDDMKALWNDPVVRLALKNHHQTQDAASFFLNELDRVADRSYAVTDDDVFRARFRTLGIQEYQITFNRGFGRIWHILDVGGCRTLRHAWLPYFKNVDVIIFLSPVSVFDQHLEEDESVNRLDDSFNIWTAICSSQLLAKTQLILLLNKCDLLTEKLRQGIKVSKYLPSYGDRSNDTKTFVKYVREFFMAIMRRVSPNHRQGYVYLTTSDTETYHVVRNAVGDALLRENLVASRLL